MKLAALIATGALAYIYIGYPVVIAILARLFGRSPRTESDARPMVSALLTVYNGADFLDAKLRSIDALDYPSERLEILVYLDGCTDESAAIARAFAAERSDVVVVEAAERRGKPTGLNELARRARGDVFLLTDVRQPIESGALVAFVAALSEPGVGCASGNLVLEGATGAGLYWRYEKWIRDSEGHFRSMLGATGSICALEREAFEELPPDTILDDMWLPMRARLRGLRTVFVAGARATDRAFDDGREFGRKVRTLAGNFQLFARLPGLLSPLHNPSWFETISHKVLRLLGPWIMVGLAVTSSWAAAGGDRVGQVLVAGQLCFYMLALGGGLLGGIGRTARSFVVLNAAAVVGLLRFLTGRQRITW